MDVDITVIDNSVGFFALIANTDLAQWWLGEYVQGYSNGVVYTDSRQYAQDIVCGAVDAGLTVN